MMTDIKQVYRSSLRALFAVVMMTTSGLVYSQSSITVLSVSSPDVSDIQWYRYVDSAMMFMPIMGETNPLFMTSDEGVYYATFMKGDCENATSYAQIKCSVGLQSEPVTIVAGNAEGGTYQWLLDGVALLDSTNQMVQVSQPGTYQVVMDKPSCPADTQSYVLIGAECCRDLDLVVLLEGAYDSTANEMTTLLNYYNLLPGQDPELSVDFLSQLVGVATTVGQPYFEAPWLHTGAEGDLYGDSTIITDAGRIAYPPSVVDWVLVSLRTTPDVTSTIYTCAMLLHEDGTVETPEDCPCLDLASGMTYRVVIEHRNHIAVMSEEIEVDDQGILAFNFTENIGWMIPTGSPDELPQKLVAGRYVMIGGNSDQSSGGLRGDVNALDLSQEVQQDFGRVRTYLKGDNNLDGDITSQDRTRYVETNLGIVNFVF